MTFLKMIKDAVKGESTVGDHVDQLLDVQAAIAELKDQERVLKDALIGEGAGAYEGQLGRATVTEVADTVVFDSAKARSIMTPAQVKQCMKEKAGYWRVSVKARRGRKAA